MNMLGLSSSVRFAHIACYWKFFLLHYTQVLSVHAMQGRSCLSYLSYATRQPSHLNGLKLDSVAQIVLIITPLHGPSRKHRLQQYLYCCMLIRCLETFQSRSLATAVSLAPQFLVLADMPWYKCRPIISGLRTGSFNHLQKVTGSGDILVSSGDESCVLNIQVRKCTYSITLV
jgi:hypothetical protein